AVGIAVDVRVYEWGTLYADVRSGNFELASLAWVGVTDPDLYYLAFHSTMLPPAGYNRGAYVSRVTDRLTKAGRQTFEPARRRALVLARPLAAQYVRFLARAARGDLGQSIAFRAPVARVIAARYPATLELAAAAFALALVFALPLGVLAAVRRGTALDRAA